MAPLQRVRLTAPSGGIDVDSAPAIAKGDKAIVLQNYLTGEAGRVKQRGPLTVDGVAYATSDKRISGALPGNDKLLAAQKNADSATRTVEPWVAPRRNAVGADLSQTYVNASGLKLLDLKANTKTDMASSRSTSPSWAWTRMGNFVYFVAYDSDNDDDTIPTGAIGVNDRGGRQRLTRYCRWNISTPTTIPVQYTYGPYGMQDIRLHYNRLFFLGGRHPDTVGPYVENNCLWFTRTLSANHHNYGFSPNDFFSGSPPVPNDDDNIVGGVDATWPHRSPAFGEADADHVGVYNRIDLPWEEDFGVCFASIGRNLGIFKRKYILLLQGFEFDSFQLRTAITGVGCLDPRSVVEANEGAFFLSQNGFMFFDGVQLHNASPGMNRTLLSAALAAVGDEGTDGGFAIAELLSRDYIMLTIGVAPFAASPGTPTVTFCGIYHIASNSWATFTSEPLATTGDGPIWLGLTENRFALLDHSKFRVATKLTTPDQATEAQRGKDEDGGGDTTIETKWHSKVVELASPFEEVQHKRVIVDYEWVVDEGTADNLTTFDPEATVTTRPRVQIVDGGGTVLQTFYLPQDGNSGTEARELLRQRFTYDYFADTPDVQVRIEYPSTNTPTALVSCCILDVWVEYSVAADRRNA